MSDAAIGPGSAAFVDRPAAHVFISGGKPSFFSRSARSRLKVSVTGICCSAPGSTRTGFPPTIRYGASTCIKTQ